VENWGALRKIKKRDLEENVAATFDEYVEKRGIDSHALLVETQTYQQELRRREERKSRLVDLGLEFLIVVLIGWEIWEGRSQSDALSKVAKSAEATATALQTVQSTMQAMNDTIQAQNAEANRVLLDARYAGNWLYLTNTGHPTIFVYVVRTDDLPVPPLTPTPNISTGQRVQLPAPQVEEAFQEKLKTRTRYVMPIELDLTDGTGEQYIARSELVGIRASTPGGGMSITMNTLVVSQHNWRSNHPAF
jgi:hypothetical protein